MLTGNFGKGSTKTACLKIDKYSSKKEDFNSLFWKLYFLLTRRIDSADLKERRSPNNSNGDYYLPGLLSDGRGFR